MFKSILLAVDASRYSEVCTRYAVEFAKIWNARIMGLSVVDHKEFAIVYPYYYPTADFPPLFDEAVFEKNELLLKQRERAEEILQRIKTECEKQGIDFQCEVREGIVTDTILEECSCCDILFLGQRGVGAPFSSGLLGSNLENVVRRSALPVIVTPHTYRPLRKVLACFDGSDYSVKAIQTAARFCSACPDRSTSLKLLVVDDDEEKARKIAEKAVRYLEAYSIYDVLVTRKGEPAEQIVAAAEEEDADLVAMGAYGHSHVREMVLGSTTERVLRNVNRALLLHH